MDLLESFNVSIDNLTITGIPRYKPREIFETFAIRLEVTNSWIRSNGKYHYNLSLQNGSLLQITHETNEIQGIRVEFNPNKIIGNGFEKIIIDILKCFKQPKITRVDIAVDLYGVDMNHFNVLDFAGRKIVEYKTSSRQLETMYLGIGKSEDIVRIYDKAKEQKIKLGALDEEEVKKLKLDHKWWRVESQLRGSKAMAFSKTGQNPFEKLKITYKSDFSKYDLKTRAMLSYLQDNPDTINELSINVRSKYKKMLAEQTSAIEVEIDFEKMIAQHSEELIRDIATWLNFCHEDIEEKVHFKQSKSVLIDGNVKRNLDE